jgi:hypothetical protein
MLGYFLRHKGEDTKRNLKHAKRLQRLNVRRCGGAGIDRNAALAYVNSRRGEYKSSDFVPSSRLAPLS